MSMTSHLMSSSPSSKTANSPQGPAPMMRASVVIVSSSIVNSLKSRALELLFGNPDHQAVERLGHLDLARQPAVVANVEGEIEHVFLHFAALSRCLHPLRLDEYMAGGAGAGAAAIGIDPRHHVLHRAFHDGHAGLRIDGLHRSVVLDECYFDHRLRYENSRHSSVSRGLLGYRTIKHNVPFAHGPDAHEWVLSARLSRNGGLCGSDLHAELLHQTLPFLLSSFEIDRLQLRRGLGDFRCAHGQGRTLERMHLCAEIFWARRRGDQIELQPRLRTEQPEELVLQG